MLQEIDQTFSSISILFPPVHATLGFSHLLLIF